MVHTFQGTTVDEIEQAFKDSVFCKERGEEPDRPFSWKFNLRRSAELLDEIKLIAHKFNEGCHADLLKKNYKIHK